MHRGVKMGEAAMQLAKQVGAMIRLGLGSYRNGKVMAMGKRSGFPAHIRIP